MIGVYVFSLHVVHILADSAGEYVPAGQAEHQLAISWSANVPAAHAVQLVEPSRDI